MTALERLKALAGNAMETGASASTGTAAGTYETGTSGTTGMANATNAAASEVNLDFLVTVTVSVVQVTS